jgi:hypothetical protein
VLPLSTAEALVYLLISKLRRRRLGHFEFKTLFCTPQAVRFQGCSYEIIRPVYVRNRYKSQAGTADFRGGLFQVMEVLPFFKLRTQVLLIFTVIFVRASFQQASV